MFYVSVLVFCFLGIFSAALGQVVVKNIQFETNAYDSLSGQKGLHLIWEIQPPKQAQTLTLHWGLMQGQDTLYQEKQWCLVSPRSLVQKQFLPLRLLDLPAGQHQATLFLNLEGAKNWSQNIAFQQAQRYICRLTWSYGEAKRRRKPYDLGPPKGQAPDLYTGIYLHRGQDALAQSPVLPNRYQLEQGYLEFFALEGDSLIWHIYDEDGETDECLAQIPLPRLEHDLQRNYQGQMQGNMRALDYEWRVQSLKIQPFSLKPLEVNPQSWTWEIDYAVSAALKGRSVETWTWTSLNLRGDTLHQWQQAPRNPTPNQLARRGQYYFDLAYHEWRSETRKLALSLKLDNGLVLESSPYFLAQNFNPPPALLAQKLEIQKEIFEEMPALALIFQGKLGALSPASELHFRLFDSNQNEKTHALIQHNTKDSTGTWLEHRAILRDYDRETWPSQGPYRLELWANPSDLKTGPLNLLDTLLRFDPVEEVKNYVKLSLLSQADVFEAPYFGRSLHFRLELPKGLKDKAILKLEAHQNSDTVQTLGPRILNDWQGEGRILHLHWPYASLNLDDSLSLKLSLSNQEGQILSPTLIWGLRLGSEQAGQAFSLKLKKLNLAKNKNLEANQASYQLELGETILHEVPLFPKSLRQAAEKKLIYLHPQDKFSLYLQMGPRRIRVWRERDWAAWQLRAGKRAKIKFGPLPSPLDNAIFEMRIMAPTKK